MKSLVLVASLLAVCAYAAEDATYYPSDVSPWASAHLAAMHEPSLYHPEVAKPREEYRFLWLRTFHKPIAIRIWADAAAAQMRVVGLSGAGGYDPGKIDSDKTVKLSPDDWKRFRDCVAKAEFWQMPTKESNEELGFDGSQWILEGRADNKYHVIDRWTPRGGTYYDCCRMLVSLAKLDIPQDEFY